MHRNVKIDRSTLDVHDINKSQFRMHQRSNVGWKPSPNAIRNPLSPVYMYDPAMEKHLHNTNTEEMHSRALQHSNRRQQFDTSTLNASDISGTQPGSIRKFTRELKTREINKLSDIEFNSPGTGAPGVALHIYTTLRPTLQVSGCTTHQDFQRSGH